MKARIYKNILDVQRKSKNRSIHNLGSGKTIFSSPLQLTQDDEDM